MFVIDTLKILDFARNVYWWLFWKACFTMHISWHLNFHCCFWHVWMVAKLYLPYHYSRYSQALVDCQQCYFSQREQLLGPSISSTINDLATKHVRDHCALVSNGDGHVIFGLNSSTSTLYDMQLYYLCLSRLRICVMYIVGGGGVLSITVRGLGDWLSQYWAMLWYPIQFWVLSLIDIWRIICIRILVNIYTILMYFGMTYQIVLGFKSFRISSIFCHFKLYQSSVHCLTLCDLWVWYCLYLQMRSGCAFMVHVCEDEYQLYYNFFTRHSPLLESVSTSRLEN